MSGAARGPHPIGTPTGGISSNTGPLATAAWLVARGLALNEPRWQIEIELAPSPATTLRVELFSEEWGYWFSHANKVSWIRVTDVPFVHGRDEHGLLACTPSLKNLGQLVRELERRCEVRFPVDAPVIRTTLADADPAIRAWLGSW